MSRAYHGKNTFASIKPQHEAEILLLAQAAPEHINFILKMVESHCHIALPVQINPREGLLGFHTTRDRVDELLSILANLPLPLQVLS